MAVLTRKPLMSVQFSVADRSSRSNTQFNIGQSGGNWADIGDADFITYLQEFATHMEDVSDCSVLKVSVTQEYIVNAPVAFGSSPENERKGVFQFNTTGGYFGRVSIPGLNPEALLNDGININRVGTVFGGSLAAPLQGIHDKLQNGATVNLVTYPVVDGAGRDFNGLNSAYQQHRKSLKPRSQIGG